MNSSDFITKYDDYKKIIDSKIKNYFHIENVLDESMNYAINSGKRIRPILFMNTLEMLQTEIDDEKIQIALCIELIHNYSLVHDDLPAMDNDDYRRGNFTVHKKYGYDVAILCGDALLNFAYENLFDICMKSSQKSLYLKAFSYIAKMAGNRGMIKGQILDIKRDVNSFNDLLEIYILKTSNLFLASIMSAAIIAEADDLKKNKLYNFAKNLGILFQINDDLKDDGDGDLSILNYIEKKQAKKVLEEYAGKCRENLKYFSNNNFLMNLIDYLT